MDIKDENIKQFLAITFISGTFVGSQKNLGTLPREHM